MTNVCGSGKERAPNELLERSNIFTPATMAVLRHPVDLNGFAHVNAIIPEDSIVANLYLTARAIWPTPSKSCASQPPRWSASIRVWAAC